MHSKALMFVPVLATWACAGDPAARLGVLEQAAVVVEPLAIIGEVEGAPEYLFGDVASVAVGPGGVVYVADRIGSSLRAYDLDGRFLGTVAAEGLGPGELQSPNDVAFDPSGRLYVRDGRRITVFARADGSRLADSLVRTVPIGGYANLSSTRARTDGRLYYYPDYSLRQGEPDRYFYLVFDSLGATGDTVHVPPLPNLQFVRSAFYRTGPGGGRMVDGLNRAPFEPSASWDVTPDGTVLVTPGHLDRVLARDRAGNTTLLVDTGREPRRVPAAEAQDSARAFQARLDSLPVRVDEVNGMSDAARSGDLPDVLPATLALHYAPEGAIWLRRWPSPGAAATTPFDVFDEDGALLRRVIVGADLLTDPPPFVSEELVVGVVVDALTDVERVVVFGVPRS